MQAVAGENNLAETAFVVPEGYRYRMRWFTPIVEVKLCGHATLAAGAVVLERLHSGRESVVFDTTSGPLSVHRRGRAYEVDLPARTVSTVSTPVELSAALGLVPLETATDAGNYIARLGTAQDVRISSPTFQQSPAWTRRAWSSPRRRWAARLREPLLRAA